MPKPTLADLERVGPPIFVPRGAWEVVGIEGSSGAPDGFVVFNARGDVIVHTEALTAVKQPLSIRVQNVQHGSVNSPDPEVRAKWARVIVDEEERDVRIGGVLEHVRVLVSHNSFSFEVVTQERRVSAAGRLDALDDLELRRVDELALAGS